MDSGASEAMAQESQAINWINFEIPGPPAPQQRHRAYLHTGTRRIQLRTYVPQKTKRQQEMIGWIAREKMQGQSPWEGLIYCRLVFYFTPEKWGHRGDIDNLVKLVLDACQGVVYRNDRQIIDLNVQVQQGQENKTFVAFREEREKGEL